MLFQFMERDQEADGIMPLCAGEAQEQGDVRLKFRVIAGQLEQGVAEVILVQAAVPAPGRIGVGEVPQAVRRTVPVVAVGAGVGMHGGAVAGDGKVRLWYEATFQGRQDGRMAEKLLQALLKVERDILPGHEPFFDGFRDFLFCLLCFLVLSFGPVRLFAVPGSGKQLIPAIQSRCRSGPEPVHEVKAGAERWKGILGTADERSEDAVILKPVCPKGKGRLDLLNIVLIGIANELPEHDERYELHRLLSALLSMELSVDEKLSIIKNEYHILVDDKLREECVGYV